MSARSALQLPDDAGDTGGRIKHQLRRFEQILTFLQEVEIALTQELRLREREVGAADAAIVGWHAELEDASTQLREARAALVAIRAMPLDDADEALASFDLSDPTTCLQSLRDRLAAPAATPAASEAPRAAPPVRPDPPRPPISARPGTGGLQPTASPPALSARPGTGGLRPTASPSPASAGQTDTLSLSSAAPRRAVTAPLPPRVRTASPGAFSRDRAAPGLADRAKLAGRKGFEAAYRLATEVLGYVGPRLTLVQTALSSTGLPGPRRPWDEVARLCPAAAQAAGVAPPMVPWVPRLAKLFLDQVDVARRALVAVNQWTTARGLHADAERLHEKLGGVPLEVGDRLLAGFPTGPYYGALFPLGNLHLQFAGVPHLSTLFPPRPPTSG